MDIDGVVNSEEWYVKTRGMKGNFDPECIKKLNRLEEFGTEIVVSSSWGEDGVKQLENVGLKLPIIGCTEHFYTDWLCRGNEIEKWLHDNFGGMGTKYGIDDDGIPYHKKRYNETDNEYEYVILDDDQDFLLGQKDNFIHVNRQTGVTDEDIEKIRQIFLEN